MEVMKRFLVFEWLAYDTAGGWHNKTGDFDTIDEAKASLRHGGDCNRYHIVDLHSGQIVKEGSHYDQDLEPAAA